MELDEVKKVFKIFDRILEQLANSIELFHVFYDFNGANIIFKTYSDQTFCLGSNQYGVLGLGHPDVVDEPQHLPELSDLNIQEIFNGADFGIAVNYEINELFAWGINNYGQLGLANSIDETLSGHKPTRVESLSDIQIETISCGSNHSLCLTTDGRVYGWGWNLFGQIGIGSDDQSVSTPTILKTLPSCKSIVCGYYCSTALTKDGQVFIWGLQPGASQTVAYKLPVKVEINEIVRTVALSPYNAYFLSNDGSIYFTGNYNQKNFETRTSKITTMGIDCPGKIINENGIKFEMISSYFIYDSCISGHCLNAGLSSDGTVFLLKNNKLIATEFSNFAEFYSRKLMVTFKTVKINRRPNCNVDQFLIDSIKSLATNDESIVQVSDRFNRQFDSVEPIGSGSFGNVFKVRDKFDGNFYCIKQIQFHGSVVESMKMIQREILVLSKLNRYKFLVRFYNFWLEPPGLAFLKIDLLDTNLKTVLQNKSKIFNRKSSKEPMDLFELYLSILLFKEIVDMVNFMHLNNIIHRDLKPENILVQLKTDDYQDMFKLTDFGLSVEWRDIDYHSDPTKMDGWRFTGNTDNLGTIGYIAPEVKEGRKYSTKADVYSLGQIGKEVFDFAFKAKSSRIVDTYKQSDSDGFEIVEKLVNLIEEMTLKDDDKRPDCLNVLFTLKMIGENDCKKDVKHKLEELEEAAKLMDDKLGEIAMFFVRFLRNLKKVAEKFQYLSK